LNAVAVGSGLNDGQPHERGADSLRSINNLDDIDFEIDVQSFADRLPSDGMAQRTG
jgi:hypothetical protein